MVVNFAALAFNWSVTFLYPAATSVPALSAPDKGTSRATLLQASQWHGCHRIACTWEIIATEWKQLKPLLWYTPLAAMIYRYLIYSRYCGYPVMKFWSQLWATRYKQHVACSSDPKVEAPSFSQCLSLFEFLVSAGRLEQCRLPASRERDHFIPGVAGCAPFLLGRQHSNHLLRCQNHCSVWILLGA